MRTTWLAELPEATWRSWFTLIERGRREGPSSPFYVEELGLQNTACCESHPTSTYKALGCLGPKCSDLGLPPNSLLTKELDAMSEYWPLFDRVYVGTTTSQSWDSGKSSTADYAALQGDIGKQFMARYGNMSNVTFAWYLTSEGSVPGIGLNPAEQTRWIGYLSQTQQALYAVKPLEFLWSPSNGNIRPNATQLVTEEAGLTHVFCSLPHATAIHFQDWLGQSVTFEFPFHYNYSAAFTCELDTVPTMAMLGRVQAACPHGLREVKVNAELFAERLSPAGQRGEDNGADIINADPHEVATRLACYAAHGFPVGCSWAINHWYYLNTYANATVYHPYDEL